MQVHATAQTCIASGCEEVSMHCETAKVSWVHLIARGCVSADAAVIINHANNFDSLHTLFMAQSCSWSWIFVTQNPGIWFLGSSVAPYHRPVHTCKASAMLYGKQTSQDRSTLPHVMLCHIITHTCIVTLACHILIADKVHAIPEGRHQGNICDGVKSTELMEGKLAIQVVNGHMSQSAIVTVDAAHNFVHHTSQLLQHTAKQIEVQHSTKPCNSTHAQAFSLTGLEDHKVWQVRV